MEWLDLIRLDIMRTSGSEGDFVDRICEHHPLPYPVWSMCLGWLQDMFVGSADLRRVGATSRVCEFPRSSFAGACRV